MELLNVTKIKLCQETIKEEIFPNEENYFIKHPQDVYDLLHHYLKGNTQESFYVMALSTKNEVLAIREVFRGTINSSVVSPREIIQFALLNNANSIVVSHSHPSGNPIYSVEDKRFTLALNKACDLMNIELIDHVIYGFDTYFSFKEDGIF